jgi:glycosyltransferase A (GT-A) superfamily protein (DUF2064 family)
VSATTTLLVIAKEPRPGRAKTRLTPALTPASKVTGTWRGTWHAVRDMRRVLAEPPAYRTGTGERSGVR